MPDNLVLPGTGATAATDDVGGVHYQRMKMAAGPDGVAHDLRVPTIIKADGSNGSTNMNIWTPSAGKRFRLMRYLLYTTGNFSHSTAQYVNVEFMDGGGAGSTFLRHLLWAPAAPTNQPFSTGWIDLGQGYLSAAPGNPLYYLVNPSVPAGYVFFVLAGTEE